MDISRIKAMIVMRTGLSLIPQGVRFGVSPIRGTTAMLIPMLNNTIANRSFSLFMTLLLFFLCSTEYSN